MNLPYNTHTSNLPKAATSNSLERTIEGIPCMIVSQAWPDPCVFGAQHILNLCHAYMSLGWAQLAIRIYITGGAHGILCFGCRNNITLQTANRCNIIKPSYFKTLQVWKRLVVERFEEFNVDVDIISC